MLLLQVASLSTVHGGDSSRDVRVGESGLYCGGGGFSACVTRDYRCRSCPTDPTCLYFVERAACEYAVANLNAAALNGVGEVSEDCTSYTNPFSIEPFNAIEYERGEGCPRFFCNPMTITSGHTGNHSIMVRHPSPNVVQQCRVATNLLARAAGISTANVGCSVRDDCRVCGA